MNLNRVNVFLPVFLYFQLDGGPSSARNFVQFSIVKFVFFKGGFNDLRYGFLLLSQQIKTIVFIELNTLYRILANLFCSIKKFEC